MKQNTDFQNDIKQVLLQFKQSYRRNMPSYVKKEINLKSLPIDRKQLNSYNDRALYNASEVVLHTIEQHINNQNSTLHEHKGLMNFTNLLKEKLNAYHINQNHAIHINKRSCKIYASLIQNLQALSNNEKTTQQQKTILQEAKKQMNTIRKLGHVETKNKLSDILSQFRKDHSTVYYLLQSN